ncbi:MAG: LysR family transcriptional regulator [Burkholderiales bacterium]|nr:LysR family transcriptional regulator [Burkholderiales bacterium]
MRVVSIWRPQRESEKIAQACSGSSTLAKSLPSLHLLKALLATAQHGSMSRAAEELHLTPGAVSKQVLELEAWLGVTLFERVRKQVLLTPVGERYVQRLLPLVRELEEATMAVFQDAGEAATLGISTVPAFGSRCLFPHLGEFRRLYPNIELRYVPYVRGYDFSSNELDCAIRYGSGSWPGAQADYLAGHEVVVIAPPPAAGTPPLKQPADIAGHTLLHHVSGPEGWKDWCAANGLKGIATQAGPRLDMVGSIVQAVAGGMGLGLLPRCVVEEEIATGAVQCPFEATTITVSGYYLCYPEAKASLPALASFRGWLLGRM